MNVLYTSLIRMKSGLKRIINVYTCNIFYSGADTINRQAVLCHRVLRTLQQVARGPATLERETWESLLLFLIGINDALLAPPAVREDAGEQLCERVLGVLLEVSDISTIN